MLRKLLFTILALLSTGVFAAIEVNTATQAQLEAVRGVGPKLSARILAERGKERFADWEDLIDRVRGIGPAAAERLSQAGLTVNGRAYSEAYTSHGSPQDTRAPAPAARLKQ